MKAEKRDKKQTHDPEEMVLLWSDTHIGSYLEVEEAGGLGEYSVDVFNKRLAYLQRSLESIVEIHTSLAPCPAFNIFFLGDIIDGTTIFPGQQRQTDLHTVKQAMHAVAKIGDFLAWLACLKPWQVNCYCIVGNHGRVGRKGEEAPLNNIEFLLYHFLAERLKEFPNISFNIPDTWFMVAERMGHRFLLQHGDDIGGWAGIPFYGVERSDARYSRMLKDYGVDFHYLCVGHHHQEAYFKSRVFMNGNWTGASELSVKNMQTNSLPTQKLIGVHHNHGAVWQRDIQLINPKNKPAIKVWR
jgi:hypothetical protein